MSNPFDQNEILFDDATHTYTVKATGQILTSPSRIIHKYAQPFDPDGSILKRCAAKEGVTPEVLNAKWKKMGDDSHVRGHNIHDSFEKFALTGKIQKDGNEDIVQDFVEQVPMEGKLYPEVTLYDIEKGIAGRTDLVEIWWDNIVNVRDFKTNKKINKYSFGKFMKPPLSHLPDSMFVHYECQISLYALMLESRGFCPKDLTLLWVNPKRKIEVMPVRYLRSEMLDMLEHYKYEKDKK